MLLSDMTKSQQSGMALYCRTEKEQNLIGITAGRIHHYRRLIYNIIDDSLRTAYPLTFNLIGKDYWDSIISDFITNHKAQTPMLWRMPEEFKNYLNDSNDSLEKDFPFIWDLLEFEWKEIEIYMMEDNETGEYLGEGSFDEDKIIFNPDFQVLKLQYPVHTKNAKKVSEKDKGEYYVLIFRNKVTGEVIFIDLSIFHLWLINELMTSATSLIKIIERASTVFGVNDISRIKQNALSFLNEMKEKQFILGFSPKMG